MNVVVNFFIKSWLMMVSKLLHASKWILKQNLETLMNYIYKNHIIMYVNFFIEIIIVNYYLFIYLHLRPFFIHKYSFNTSKHFNFSWGVRHILHSSAMAPEKSMIFAWF